MEGKENAWRWPKLLSFCGRITEVRTNMPHMVVQENLARVSMHPSIDQMIA